MNKKDTENLDNYPTYDQNYYANTNNNQAYQNQQQYGFAQQNTNLQPQQQNYYQQFSNPPMNQQQIPPIQQQYQNAQNYGQYYPNNNVQPYNVPVQQEVRYEQFPVIIDNHQKHHKKHHDHHDHHDNHHQNLLSHNLINTNLHSHSAHSFLFTCRNCGFSGSTCLDKNFTVTGIIAAIILMFIFCPLMFIPCCMNDCYSYSHHCPQCKSVV